MGFEIISFAVARFPPLDVIHFAGKVGVGVVIQDYILNSTSIDWKGKCDFNLGLRERVSCVFFVCFNIILMFVFQFAEDVSFADFLIATKDQEKVIFVIVQF